MSTGVGNCLVSRMESQQIRISVYDEDEDNGFMIIFGDNGIVLFDIMTQTVRHSARWDI